MEEETERMIRRATRLFKRQYNMENQATNTEEKGETRRIEETQSSDDVVVVDEQREVTTSRLPKINSRRATNGFANIDNRELKVAKPPSWQDEKSLVECNKQMLIDEVRCDVTFLVGKGEDAVHAHSYVLMSRSSKMAALLWNSSRNEFSKEYIFAAPNVSLTNFRELIGYLYTEELTINSVRRATEMMKAADEFGPKSLITKCFDYLQGIMCSDNVCITLEEAHVRQEETIYDRCMQFIFVNAVDVLSERGFADLCRKCVGNVVKSDRLNADEFTVYDGLIFWGRAECGRNQVEPTEQNIREALGDLLFHVRFPIMDVQEFTEKLSLKCILTSKEKIELYQFHHGDKQALSTCFDTNHRKIYKERQDFTTNKLPKIEPDKSQKSTRSSPPKKPTSPSEKESSPAGKGQVFNRTNSDVKLALYRIKRYTGISGPWLLKGPDAIAFSVSRPIILQGVIVYGPYTGSDRYDVSLCVFDPQNNQIRNEESVLLTNERNNKMYDVKLKNRVHVSVRSVYTILVRLKKGLPTYQGISGMSFIKDRGIEFEFHDSSMSHNGTNVLMGQIPGLIYSVP